MYGPLPRARPLPCQVPRKVALLGSESITPSTSLPPLFNRLLHRKPRAPGSHRGQALVEFAMVLPILVLLLLMAVDFGRVFFGYVALQNAARIGADRAAQTASAWPTANTGEEVNWRAEYQLFIENDIQAANCDYTTPHPPPVFTDKDADGTTTSFGDLATVTLTCEFGLLTPLAENIFGGPITLSGSSSFSVHGMIVAGVPDPPPPPPEPCADPVATFTTNPPANAAGGSRIDDLDPLTGSPA